MKKIILGLAGLLSIVLLSGCATTQIAKPLPTDEHIGVVSVMGPPDFVAGAIKVTPGDIILNAVTGYFEGKLKFPLQQFWIPLNNYNLDQSVTQEISYDLKTEGGYQNIVPLNYSTSTGQLFVQYIKDQVIEHNLKHLLVIMPVRFAAPVPHFFDRNDKTLVGYGVYYIDGLLTHDTYLYANYKVMVVNATNLNITAQKQYQAQKQIQYFPTPVSPAKVNPTTKELVHDWVSDELANKMVQQAMTALDLKLKPKPYVPPSKPRAKPQATVKPATQTAQPTQMKGKANENVK